jgi:two-component system OmpR family sensor kinase
MAASPGFGFGLRWRLATSSVGVLLVVLVAVGAAQYLALRAFLLSELSSELGNQARYAVTGQGGPVRAGANPGNLARAASDEEVRAAVYTLAGQQLALGPAGPGALPWARPPLDALGLSAGRLQPGAGYVIVQAGSRRLLAVAAPVGRPNRPLEVLVMEGSLDTTGSTLASDLVTYTLVAGAALLVGAALVVLLTDRALSGLRRLSHAATAVSAGDLDHRAGIAGRDEVAALGTAFDDMVGRLQREMTRQRESEEAMRRFLADASHELRTPLAMLRGNVDILRRGAADDPEDLGRSLRDMHQTALRMSRLVDDLLTLARIDQGQPLRLVEVDLTDLLEEAARSGARIVRAHPLAVEAAAGVRLRADPDALGRVLINLIDNAAKYSPARSPITVRGTASEGGGARIEVSDQGPGIPAEEQGRIFQRFQRGSGGGGRSRGAGLGLAISAAVVRRHGGSISVSSRPGAGSTFSILLPGGAPALSQSQGALGPV